QLRPAREIDKKPVRAIRPQSDRLLSESDFEIEVFEHWIVSEWLADLLEKSGEIIERGFHGLIIWGRTTSGQSIELDSVMESIHLELNA
ncbi:MAG: hypothetical protein ACSHYA_20215, partial [Opitutaceae bacterium]